MTVKSTRFRVFILARLFFTLGVNMQGTLLAWFLYEITRDALFLGLTGLAEIIPFVITLFPGGAAADKYRRKTIMLFSMSAFGLINLCFYLYARQKVSAADVWPVYFLISLTGIARGFLSPAQNAILGQLVERSELAKAATWNSAIFQTGQVLGPALGGILYGFAGPGNSFLCVALLIGTGLLFISGLKGLPAPANAGSNEPILQRIRTGIRFVTSHNLLLPAMLLDMVAVLFGGVVAVLPLFADQILHTGPEGLGWLRAAPAIGSVVSSAILLRFPPGKHAGIRMLAAVACFGGCNLIFAFSESLFASMLLLFLSGMFDSYSMIVRGALLHLYTPDDMKGRVSAVNSVFIGSSNELGAFESGLAARILGLVPSVVMGSVLTFASTGVARIRAKALVKLDLSQTTT